jgi:aminopeptidase N
VHRYRYGNADTQDFIALAKDVSGQNLSHFFNVWLFNSGKPAPNSW